MLAVNCTAQGAFDWGLLEMAEKVSYIEYPVRNLSFERRKMHEKWKLLVAEANMRGWRRGL